MAILAALYRDGRATITSMANEVGLTGPAVQGRIKRMERDGVISSYTVLTDHTKLDFAVSVHINVSLKDYVPKHVADFETAIVAVPAVIECCAVTGQADFVLRVLARDIEDLNRLLTEVIGQLPHVATFESQVILRMVKFDHSVVAEG